MNHAGLKLLLNGRLEMSEGVYLLQRFEMSDLFYQLDPRLLAEINGSGNLRRRLCLDGVKSLHTNSSNYYYYYYFLFNTLRYSGPGEDAFSF